MKYEYEQLGSGISVPCLHMDLTGSLDSLARKELKKEIYRVIDQQRALLMQDTGMTEKKVLLKLPNKVMRVPNITWRTCTTPTKESLRITRKQLSGTERLPTRVMPPLKRLVEVSGFEPLTPCLQSRCSSN